MTTLIYAIKTVATEIQPPALTEIKSIYVTFQMGVHFQWSVRLKFSTPFSRKMTGAVTSVEFG